MPTTINDAYTQWLGIPASALPPHHYALLGLAPLESDVQAVMAGYAQRTSALTAQLSGTEAATAQQLLGQLAAAQACLLNPQAKAAYDEELAKQLHRPATAGAAAAAQAGPIKRPAPRQQTESPTSSQSAPSAPLAVAAAAGATATAAAVTASAAPVAANVTTPRKQPPLEEPSSAVPWLIGGACAGLLGVAVLGLILFGRPRDHEGAVANAEHHRTTSTQDDDDAQRQQRRRDDRRSPSGKLRNRDDREPRVAPGTNPAVDLTWDKDPPVGDAGDLDDGSDLGIGAPADSSSTDDTPSDVEVVVENPLASAPRTVRLPRVRAGEPINATPAVLTRLDVDKSQPVALKLASSSLAGSKGRFELLPRGDAAEGAPQIWDVQHTSTSGESQVVGAYELADGELSFAWLPDAPAEEVADLQNQPLEVTAGDHTATIAQRTPETATPLLLKLDSGAVTTTASIESPPADAEIFLAVEEFGEEFPEHRWDSESGSVIELGKETNLILSQPEDRYQLALRFAVESAGPTKVRLEARPMFRQGDKQRWDFFRPKAAAQTLLQLRAQQQVLDAQYAQAQKRLRRNSTQLQQVTAVHNQQSAAILANIAELERVSAACEAIHDKAEVQYRLFAKDGEREIVLAQTTPTDEPPADKPAEPMDAADPNIGPPIPAGEVGPPVGEDEPPADDPDAGVDAVDVDVVDPAAE